MCRERQVCDNFFFQAEDGIRDLTVTGVQTCALPISGVAPIVSYLESLPYHPQPNCATGHFYMLNNVNPGFLPNGQPRTTGAFVPPSSVRTIGDALSERSISWRYYGGGVKGAVARQAD